MTTLLAGALLFSNTLLKEWSNNLYSDRIVYSKETQYQNIVMTKHKQDLRLYLNGNLQFSSIDEYRYHESLVHIPFGFIKQPERVLVLGGGDGLGVREILKYPSIKDVVLVDLDPAVSALAANNHHLKQVNANSIGDKRVKVINVDAYTFLLKNKTKYDVIIVDLPDPNNPSLARLYSREFYRLIDLNLRPEGIFVTQATSPFFAKKAYWTIFASIKAAGFPHALPYHVNVPSFGDWGFVVAARHLLDREQWTIDVDTRFLDKYAFERMWAFGKDIAFEKLEPSSIDRPVVVDHYLKGWTYWN